MADNEDDRQEAAFRRGYHHGAYFALKHVNALDKTGAGTLLDKIHKWRFDQKDGHPRAYPPASFHGEKVGKK